MTRREMLSGFGVRIDPLDRVVRSGSPSCRFFDIGLLLDEDVTLREAVYRAQIQHRVDTEEWRNAWLEHGTGV